MLIKTSRRCKVLGGVAGIKADEEEEANEYKEERREAWLITFDRNGARAALRFCIRPGKEREQGGGYLQSQV